jgi:glycosyltransferase involved in cell wall biosynthesis
MRIAHVITRMIVGGAQENTLVTCQDLLHTYGDEVLLITGPAIGPEGDLLKQGRGAEVPVAQVDSLRRAIHPWRDWHAYRGISRVLRDFRPEVVHTHSAKAGILGRLAAWSLHVPAIVHSVEGAPFGPFNSWPVRKFYQACEWFAARRCHHLISVADAMTDLMVDAQMAPREKFTTIHSGMDVEPFLHADDSREQTRRELGFGPQHVVVGKIARLFHLKGHEDVVAAAKQVVPRNPLVRFLLVGDGILRPALERAIAQTGLSEHFHFTGLVPPSRIPALIGAMDVLVHASLREGLARALPQALLAGKPVVSYDIDGAREVCITGQTGYLVPPRDVAALADAVAVLASDSGTRQRLGAEGRRRFTDQFRRETMTRRIRELYDKLLESASQRQSSVGLLSQRDVV